jgi:hypothetical protein
MRFADKLSPGLLIAQLAATLVPVYVVCMLLRAEGPIPVLLVWAGISAILLGLSGIGHRIFSVLAPLTVSGGIFAVLLQLAVAPRSMAEAWLALAREGNAFGFFSFFASELYALFALVQSVYIRKGRWGSFLLAFGLTSFLCTGIILDRPLFLVLAILFAFALFIASRKGSLGTRLAQTAFPLVTAVVLAGLLANPGAISKLRAPDFTGPLSSLFAQLAPNFPLVREMPGYGFTAGAEEMPKAIVLSGRTLFRAWGESDETVYLTERTFRNWNGTTWEPDENEGGSIRWEYAVIDGERKNGTIRLELVDDFYPVVPLADDTVLVRLSTDAQAEITATLRAERTSRPEGRTCQHARRSGDNRINARRFYHKQLCTGEPQRSTYPTAQSARRSRSCGFRRKPRLAIS